MSRWIDAEHAEFRLQCCGTYHGVIAFDTVKAVLNDAPSIDIVRCQDCKHAHMTYGGDCKYCDMWKDDDDFCIELYLDGDFYCAYGERKESE